MTNQSTNLNNLLKVLTENVDTYYIKQKKLASQEGSEHIIFSYFKPIKGKITPTLLQQHIKKEITLAISVKNSNILVFEYRGEQGFAFGALLFRLLKDVNAQAYIIKYSLDKLIIFIKPNNGLNLTKLSKTLDQNLQTKLTKEWRIYPIKSRPNLGNLLILPREYIESPWSF